MFLDRYASELARAYPAQPDGKALAVSDDFRFGATLKARALRAQSGQRVSRTGEVVRGNQESDAKFQPAASLP